MAYSILIVDDDRTFVEELKSALQWNRLRITEVYTAFSVREAIAFLSKTKADIVLCDIEMPGGNGLQLLKWIRENHASMECIVLSSYAEFSYAQSALRFDVCDYLLKPIKAKELEETISRVVGLLDARRGWQEEPLETLWAALFDGAVKQGGFHSSSTKAWLNRKFQSRDSPTALCPRARSARPFALWQAAGPAGHFGSGRPERSANRRSPE